jgi:hypothetical protein
MHNSLFDMAGDVELLPVKGLPRDFLHWIVLGLFGYHIVKATHTSFIEKLNRGRQSASRK